MDYEIRNDTGVKEGDEISIFYDPMIAKLSTWGKDRKSAIKFMEKALDEFCIQPGEKIEKVQLNLWKKHLMNFVLMD